MHIDADDDIPAAIPAAAPVERGRFVLDVRDRDDDDEDDAEWNDRAAADGAPPPAPTSSLAEDTCESLEQMEERALERDWDRLLGPVPRRSNSGDGADAILNLEVDGGGEDAGALDRSHRRKRLRKGSCHCCPGAVRRGPWQLWAALRGGEDAPRHGNMIVLWPACFRARGFGIIGPHW